MPCLSHPRLAALRIRMLCAALLGAALPAASQAQAIDLQRPATARAILKANPLPSPLKPFGDYWLFATPDDGLHLPPSGLRASTGLVGAPHPFSLFDTRKDDAPLPYLGLGYSGLWLRSQLSLDADFGLASQSPGNVGHLRNVFNGVQTLDDVMRDLRWSPVMAVRLAWAF